MRTYYPLCSISVMEPQYKVEHKWINKIKCKLIWWLRGSFVVTTQKFGIWSNNLIVCIIYKKNILVLDTLDVLLISKTSYVCSFSSSSNLKICNENYCFYKYDCEIVCDVFSLIQCWNVLVINTLNILM